MTNICQTSDYSILRDLVLDVNVSYHKKFSLDPLHSCSYCIGSKFYNAKLGFDGRKCNSVNGDHSKSRKATPAVKHTMLELNLYMIVVIG